ncbi:hypothetical protein [Leuconostoc sp. C2]|uniref:hypothetical protein n=1 Tax=Leuconostoc sp. (strain C2) TaxID=979982 RepID=UPI000217421E|nr:hypothetical protein [Leuconostoc sp. C2]AEJ31452.1 hypothetical protein LGMK_07010 [Leuconostoc sp. C2]
MNKKFKVATVTTLGAAALLLGGVGAGYAASNWIGHNDMVQVQVNLDKLANQLSKNQADLATAKQDVATITQELQQAKNGQADLNAQLAQQKQQYEILSKQKDDQATTFNQQLQDKMAETQKAIQDGNDKVNAKQAELNAKQAEVNGKNQVISELTKKLSDQKNANDADMAQAVKDAQDTRDKSDQIVNQYVGK